MRGLGGKLWYAVSSSSIFYHFKWKTQFLRRTLFFFLLCRIQFLLPSFLSINFFTFFTTPKKHFSLCLIAHGFTFLFFFPYNYSILFTKQLFLSFLLFIFFLFLSLKNETKIFLSFQIEHCFSYLCYFFGFQPFLYDFFSLGPQGQ